VIIRINPDAYDDVVTGRRVPSCFRYSQQLNCVTVHPERTADWEMRLSVLKSWVEHFLEFPPQLFDDPEGDVRFQYVMPIELFYDDVAVKWPNGKNTKREAQHKATGKKRKAAAEAAAADCLAGGFTFDSDDDGF
jgi:hypothetical protein